MSGYEILSVSVKKLSEELPGLTFGYTGNIERDNLDFRNWSIFLPHVRVGGSMDAVWLGSTKQLDARAAEWNSLAAEVRRKYHAVPYRAEAVELRKRLSECR